MTSRDFCYWLQGFFEVNQAGNAFTNGKSIGLTHDQLECIQRHLSLVFTHEIDPSFGDKPTQDELNKIHNQFKDKYLARC